MNTYEFTQNIPVEQVATIFKKFFEEHMLTYDMLRGIEFHSLNSVSTDSASIIYSIRLYDDQDKDKLIQFLRSKSSSMVIYDHKYTPEIYLNGDLLCISISKNS